MVILVISTIVCFWIFVDCVTATINLETRLKDFYLKNPDRELQCHLMQS